MDEMTNLSIFLREREFRSSNKFAATKFVEFYFRFEEDAEFKEKGKEHTHTRELVGAGNRP